MSLESFRVELWIRNEVEGSQGVDVETNVVSISVIKHNIID